MHDRSILVGATRSASLERLEEAIRRAGVRVERVERGPEVIERALFARYDAIVLDATLELLPAPQVRDLLRANPRTHSVPVVMIDLDARAEPSTADLYQAEPLADTRWLDDLLQVDPDRGDGPGALSARLDEMALIDMLQMLIQNRRSGVIELSNDNHRGRIELAGDRFGRVSLDDGIGGLKALVRLVAMGEGELKFEPNDGIQPDMEGSADALLFEAVQLRDEVQRFRGEVPPGSRVLVKAGDQRRMPSGGLLEDILLLVDFYGAVDDILERLEYPDAEILRGILDLRDDGWVELRVPEVAGTDGAAFQDIEVGRRARDLVRPSVWLFGRDADVMRLLWSDPRFKQRVLLRRSLRNPGRFGGNGWFVDLGGNRNLWLRSIEPMPGAAKLIGRRGVDAVGAVFLLNEQDGDDLDDMIATAVDLSSAGVRTVWLPVEAAAGVTHADAWIGAVAPELPGHLLPLADDVVAGVWEALGEVLREVDDG